MKLLGRENDDANEQDTALLNYGQPPAGMNPHVAIVEATYILHPLPGSVAGISTAPMKFLDSVFSKKNPSQTVIDNSVMFRTYNSVFLQSGDQAFTNHWIVWNQSTGGTTSIPTIGMIMEVLQFVGSNDEHKEMASLVTVRRAITGEWHPHYGMRQIELTTEYLLVRLQVCTMHFLNEKPL